jgi:hypothetical protein
MQLRPEQTFAGDIKIIAVNKGKEFFHWDQGGNGFSIYLP